MKKCKDCGSNKHLSSKWHKKPQIDEDLINKIESLIGYLEYFTNKRTGLENASDEIIKVIEEAKEWVKKLKIKSGNA